MVPFSFKQRFKQEVSTHIVNILNAKVGFAFFGVFSAQYHVVIFLALW